MTNREMLEAAIILRGMEQEVPAHVTEEWFHWAPAQAAWRHLRKAQLSGHPVSLADLMTDPDTNPVTEAGPLVGRYIVDIQDAVTALSAYVDTEWLAGQWRAAHEAQQADVDIRTVMSRLLTALDQRLSLTGEAEWVTAQEAAMQVWNDLERRREGTSSLVLPYGWASWDALTQGMEGGQLVLLGARTGVGKTLVAGNLVRNWSLAGFPSTYFSLEMKARKIMARLMAAESGLNSLVLARGTLHAADEWSAASAAMGKTGAWPVVFREQPTSLSQLTQLVRQQVRARRIRAAVVDYAGLVGNEPAYRGESTAAQVGRIAKTLKNLAMELDIVVVALVQINRQGDDAPTLKDLRDSGDWEASADVVWLFMPGATDELTAILAKNRDGQANVKLRMGWQAKSTLVWDKEAIR